jgi:predicted Fe-Mo cluster-binding NifX family protein
MLVGITSQNFKTITGHAGKTRRFIIYASDENNNWHVSERLDLEKNMSIHEFTGTDHPIDSLDVLITAGCGEGFIRKMGRRGIKVIQTGETDPLTAVNQLASGQSLKPPSSHRH